LVSQNTPTPQSDTFKQPKKVSDSSPRAGDPATTEYPGQIQDFITETETEIKKGGRVIATTLTKKMAEDLSEYLKERKIKAEYLHSEIKTIDRIQIISEFRKGKFDCLVGVNLLREGLDMPEVSLVAILDADKEGFLRSETSLIQTIGRAARNVNGQVVLYADHSTGSIERAIAETNRRRTIQLAYNEEHGITPKTIQKTIRNILEEFGISETSPGANSKEQKRRRAELANLDTLGDDRPLSVIIKDKEVQMKDAAKSLEFELAAILRDEIRELTARQKSSGEVEKSKKGRPAKKK
jgi:excinuclease ABC subunit B